MQRAAGRYVPPAVAATLVSWAFPRTHRFLYGNLPAPPEPASNILHLTLNKAASQHTARILAQLLAERGYTTVWPNRYAFFRSTPYLEHLPAETFAANHNIVAPKRVFIAAIASPPTNAELLAHTRQILAVRDPRDLVVSDYYSIRYFHPQPTAPDKRDTFTRQRAAAAAAGIDAYVLERAPVVHRQFERYAEISRAPTCLAVVRYEDFLADFAGWLATLERALELPPDSGRRARLAPLAPQRPTDERRDVKVRAAKAGQFRERLTPATIAALDREFGPVLEHFGYVNCQSASNPDP